MLNKRAVESLIKAGAFDSLGHPRKGLLGVFEHIIDTTLTRRRERDQGVMSLFGDWDGDPVGGAELGVGFDERMPIPDVEFDKVDKLRNEKEMLGLYVSDHPLFGVEAALAAQGRPFRRRAGRDGRRSPVHIGGVVTGLTRKFTRKGDQMAVFVLEDLEASVEVTLFPRTLQEHGYKLADDVVVAVKGRLDRRDESRVRDLPDRRGAPGARGRPAPLRLRIPSTSLDELRIARLKRILRDHPGDSVVTLDLGTPGAAAVGRLPRRRRSLPSASCAWPSVTTP